MTISRLLNAKMTRVNCDASWSGEKQNPMQYTLHCVAILWH